MLIYALTIFLSAFLLFQVQPIIAKSILPWFGGSAAVWTTCMLFFQMELLLGYAYAHFTIHRLDPKKQAKLHMILLAICVVLMPIVPKDYLKPVGGSDPTFGILALLAVTVGLPYMLLSTTGPLVQAWFARANKGAVPYRLFALSNLGSMIALLTYPPLVEPYLSTRFQANAWSTGFIVFVVLCSFAALKSSKFPSLTSEPAENSDSGAPPAITSKIFWIALAACPSMLMLAVTTHLTQDVASIPFLWLVPLTIYLLSFILTFDATHWYPRNLFLVLLAPALGGMAYMQWTDGGVETIENLLHSIGDKYGVKTLIDADLGIKTIIAVFALALFICCMVCHGELSRRRPAPKYLTSFFLMLSIGGAVGGLFVGLVAPYMFKANFELPLAIMFCGVLAFLVSLEEEGMTPWESLRSMSSIAMAFGVLGLCIFLGRSMRDSVGGFRVVERNFYGMLRVRQTGQPNEWNAFRTLMHGSINHGEQWINPSRRREPTSYYCSETGIGRAIRLRQTGVPQRVGVLGLGSGTMAVFGRKGDYYRFYEINPLVPPLANSEFSFVPDSEAKVEIAMGDGRLSLESEPDQNFDILMMDAFSGDSIPVHLCTREAFQLFFRHLKPNGVLAMHISNKYLNLEPVIARLAKDLGKHAMTVESSQSADGNCFSTTFVLVANTPAVFNDIALRGAGAAAELDPKVGVWTDNYSNLYRILK
jgi:hypothetical protein